MSPSELAWGVRFRLQNSGVLQRLRFFFFLFSYSKGYRVVLWRIGFRKPFDIEIEDSHYRVSDPISYSQASKVLRGISHGVQPGFDYPSDAYEGAGVGSLLSVGFVYGGVAHRLYFPAELKDKAPISLRRLFNSRALNQVSVQGKVVVDVGSFIGDSSLYFALRGARKVIAFEPTPQFCSVAEVNVEKNGFGGVIEVINEGAGNPGFTQHAEKTGERMGAQEPLIHQEWKATGAGGVRINSLRDMVARFNPGLDAVLKVNCEGCEYALILAATREDLRVFSEIVLEYHYGGSKIRKRLESCGFSVSSSENQLQFNRRFTDPRLEVGLLCATRLR